MRERPTFSPFWHRVRTMHPRLRPHVEVTRQRYRGRRWHVAHDPASNQFYRLNPVAYGFVGTLDGTRTVEDAWKLSLARFGDAAPTQNEVIELLSQLYNANLLAIDSTPEVEQLLRRGRERTHRRIKQQAIGIMYFRLRLFNPDRLLSAIEPIVRPLLNRWAFLAWCLFVGYAFSQLLPHWDRLVSQFRSFTEDFSPGYWGWLAAMFVLTKAIHELGHGLICRRLGGQVPEFGVMLLVLFPSPYVDASSCWAFPSKWQRAAVGAGGMLFELALAACASFVWRATPDGSLVNLLAFNVLLTASVSTVLFNANPLMRFDGYYILADVLEIPNLMQRSNEMLKYLVQRHIFRMERAMPPSSLAGEQATLVVYGLLSMVYRVFLFLSIVLFLLGQLFIIGVVLAVWTLAAWFLLPTGALVHWLATNPQIAERRGRVIATTLGMVALGAGLVGLVPLPDYRRTTGVVESERREGVFFGADGFVLEAHARPGDAVREGDPIVTLRSEELVAAARQLEAAVRETETDRREALDRGEPAGAQIAEGRLEAIRDKQLEIARRLDALVVRAPHDGVIVGGDPATLVGAYVRRGDRLCEVVDTGRLRVAAVMAQGDAAWLFELPEDAYRIEMRLYSDVHTVRRGARAWAVPAGQHRLSHAALGFRGGGSEETDPRDERGTALRRPRFRVYVEPEAGADWPGAPGERVRVRFTLPAKPIVSQVVDRVQKTLQGRIVL